MPHPRFIQRRPGHATISLALARQSATLMPEALRHASSLFDHDDPVRYHLYDASVAVEAALATSPADPVPIGFTADEIPHLDEALRHVAREVFEEGRERDALAQAARAVRDLHGKL